MFMLDQLQIENMTDEEVSTVIAQLQNEQNARKRQELKKYRDAAIEALENFIEHGGWVVTEGYHDSLYLENSPCCSIEIEDEKIRLNMANW